MAGALGLMAGGNAFAVDLQGLDPTHSVLTPANASATYTLTNTGAEQATGVASGTWLVTGTVADYEVRATLNSGALTSGTVGSWLSLSTSRSWNVTRTDDAAGTTSASMLVEIRVAATTTVIDSATVDFTARVLP
jgi:hypothetical protein